MFERVAGALHIVLLKERFLEFSSPVRDNTMLQKRMHSTVSKNVRYYFPLSGQQSISFMATDIWKDLPTHLKSSSVSTFPKKIKRYLLSEQQIK